MSLVWFLRCPALNLCAKSLSRQLLNSRMFCSCCVFLVSVLCRFLRQLSARLPKLPSLLGRFVPDKLCEAAPLSAQTRTHFDHFPVVILFSFRFYTIFYFLFFMFLLFFLFLLLLQPSANYRAEKAMSDKLNFPKHTGIREASLLLVKEKCGRYTLIREPLYLDRCVVCSEADWDDYFEVQEISSKDTFIFKVSSRRQAISNTATPT